MTLPRCKYGYFGGIGEWGQWETLEDGSFDQCRRQEHGKYGLSWHFPESGGAVSKHGKRIDDPEKWEPMWKSIQEREASDGRSLDLFLWENAGSFSKEPYDWWLVSHLTPRMARTLLKLAEPGWSEPLPVGHLIRRKLVEESRPTELTPLGRRLTDTLKGWDRA